ncbi:MAG: outer membrane beta-barrel protein [Oceanospirillaceae bacterium]
MPYFKRHNFAAIFIGFSITTPTFAIEPAAIALGEMGLYPSLTIVTGRDDNVLATETAEISSWITRIAPNLLLEAETDDILMQFNYSLEKGIVHSSTNDNYLDHNLTPTIKIIGNSRNRVEFSASIIKGHEARGEEEGGAITITDAPLEFDSNSLRAKYNYGGLQAKGQIEVNASYEDKEFTNFRTVTIDKDYDQFTFGTTFKYRLTPKTSALATISQKVIDYDASSNKDSTTMRYLLGATWEATAKTSGTIKVGWSEKDFDDPTSSDVDGGTWDAEVNWNPKSYSTFIFSTGQEFGETTTDDSFVDSVNYGVSWNHYWQDNFKSTLAFNKKDDDYSNSTRKDTTNTVIVGVNYEAKRWLNLGLGYTMTDKDTNQADASFKKNTLMMTVQGSL